ncbi:hypothetical protein FACS189431_0370 [Alphaproteobacteria bacterium]|nr:hypothetical protein FACS189431_0370 [Alphaproteobacteria bacterium]
MIKSKDHVRFVAHAHKILGIIDIAALIAFLAALAVACGLIPNQFFVLILVLVGPIFLLFIFLNIKTKWRASVKNISLVVANLIWLAVMTVFLITILQVNTTLDRLSDVAGCTENCASEVELDKPMIIYISGEDAFGDIDERSRSDVNQIAVVSPTAHKILLINTPRDYYVSLHNRGPLPDKLTHAGNFGVAESMGTLSDLYGIQIDKYMKVNFESLMKLVDILGGITVYSDLDFTDAHVKHHFVRGENVLDSKLALAFCRERYAFDDGDRQRGKNQQKVIEAIFNKVKTTDALANYQKILDALAQDLRTNMTGGDIKKTIQTIVKDQYTFETVSVTGSGAMLPTYSYPGQKLYVMVPDQASVDAVKAKLVEYLQSDL